MKYLITDNKTKAQWTVDKLDDKLNERIGKKELTCVLDDGTASITPPAEVKTETNQQASGSLVTKKRGRPKKVVAEKKTRRKVEYFVGQAFSEALDKQGLIEALEMGVNDKCRVIAGHEVTFDRKVQYTLTEAKK